MNLYNDNDPYVVKWLGNLVAAGKLPRGHIGERILDVESGDLAGYDQAHFFADAGGWAYAPELAGWQDPVWTGSRSCQSWSTAGKRAGANGPRHLWPAWFWLIERCLEGNAIVSPLAAEFVKAFMEIME